MDTVKIETCTTEAQSSEKARVNGYRIIYNQFWETYQVNHLGIAALLAEFDTYEEAEEYCKNG